MELLRVDIDDCLHDLFANLDQPDLEDFINRAIKPENLGYPIVMGYLAINLGAFFDGEFYSNIGGGSTDNKPVELFGAVEQFFQNIDIDKTNDQIGVFCYIEWICKEDLVMKSVERCQNFLMKAVKCYSSSFNGEVNLTSIVQKLF